MRILIFVLGTLFFLTAGTEFKGKNWVLLIAGSLGYTNYRHQSDICHAYQIFRKNGIPEKQIIVMMYDDIANNYNNPTKGKITNRPDGPNVYAGVPKDYTGWEVRSDVFFAVLEGDKEKVKNLTGQYKKVIDSGHEDHIFVNYVDHGQVGMLGIPTGSQLYGHKLNEALQRMHQNKRYAKLVLYIEACNSGSMFDGLLSNDINVYATTAADPIELSYACFCDANLFCLGDLYSVNWMEDTEKANLQTRTLQQQYITVKEKTKSGSTVMQYGDTSIASLTLDKFFGNGNSDSEKDPVPSSKDSNSDAQNNHSPTKRDTIHNAMTRVQPLIKRIHAAPLNSIERLNLEKELNSVYLEMKQTHDLFNNIARSVYTDLPDNELYDLAFRKRSSIKNWDCYEAAVDKLSWSCPGTIGNNDLAFRKLYILVNFCNVHNQVKVISAIESAIAASPICLKDSSQMSASN